MKIFVQSASLQQIQHTTAAGLADGVVLSPIDLALEDPAVDIKDRLADMARELALPTCVPVSAVLGDEVYDNGHELASVSDQVIVQIPFLEDTLRSIRRLATSGVRVCATHVYSGAQAFFAAKVGAMMVSVNVDDVDAHGRHSSHVVQQIRAVLDRSGLECDLSVTSARDAAAFTDYLLAGADTAVITPPQLDSLIVHSLTDRGVDRFLSDLSRRHKPRTL